ncbi:MAG: helix-hairpin-helix domain-containing protein [Acidobacteria bacterium]|nr:helix-hairpin-helix domain-containing protein [Acidobacteriota bacterium]
MEIRGTGPRAPIPPQPDDTRVESKKIDRQPLEPFTQDHLIDESRHDVAAEKELLTGDETVQSKGGGGPKGEAFDPNIKVHKGLSGLARGGTEQAQPESPNRSGIGRAEFTAKTSGELFAGKIDLNTASRQQFMDLGLSAESAAKVMEARPFDSLAALRSIPGLSAAEIQQLEDSSLIR